MVLGAGFWLRGLPGFIIGLNGLVGGIVVAVAAGVSGMGIIVSFLMLLPHGLFELPSFIGSGALALRVNRWKRMGPDERVRADDARWIARCFGVIVILLVIAAAIEAALIEAVPPPQRRVA